MFHALLDMVPGASRRGGPVSSCHINQLNCHCLLEILYFHGGDSNLRPWAFGPSTLKLIPRF